MTAPTLPRSRASDLDASYEPRDVQRSWIRDRFLVVFGTTGAITSIDKSAYSITRTGTGAYDLIFPKARDVFINPMRLKSAALTVNGFVFAAYNAPAGTASIVFIGASGAAADPASGDECLFEIEMRIDS